MSRKIHRFMGGAYDVAVRLEFWLRSDSAGFEDKRDAGLWKRSDVCCVMEGRWKMLSILYCSVRSLTRIDVSFWKGSRELWEQRSG